MLQHLGGAKPLISYVNLHVKDSVGGGAKPCKIFHLGALPLCLLQLRTYTHDDTWFCSQRLLGSFTCYVAPLPWGEGTSICYSIAKFKRKTLLWRSIAREGGRILKTVKLMLRK